MQKGLISVVLPIYNVERYLDRSIKSILDQTYKDLEVILVDDGSTDTSGSKCDDWKRKDKRIKVIHKENGGLGEARNTGIENATGEYICFFDSDDYVDLGLIQKAYKRAKDDMADIVTWGVNEVSVTGKIRGIPPQTRKELYIGDEVQSIVLPELITPDPKTGKRTYLRMSAWACMFSMEKIQGYDWRFLSERKFISEDVISLLYLYRHIDRVAVIKECLYYYCENERSLTHTYRDDRFDMINFCYDACLDVCDRMGYARDVKDRLGFWYYSSVIAALKMLLICKDRKRCISDIDRVLDDPHFSEVMQKINFNKEPLKRKVLYRALKSKDSRSIYMILRLRTLS